MRYIDSILGDILKPISRRWFDGVVERHGGDAYDKKFGSWDHLVALIYAQLGGIVSLRATGVISEPPAARHPRRTHPRYHKEVR